MPGLLLLDDPVTSLGLLVFALLLVALPLAFWGLSCGRTLPAVRILVATANLALTAQLLLRWWDAGHFPISNLYESLCFLAWGCTLAQLLVERAWPSPLAPAATTPMALSCIAFASFALPERLQEASPLVPALRSSWLVMHVSVIMLSYAGLLVGSLLSLAVLFTDRGNALQLRSSSIGSGSFRKAAAGRTPPLTDLAAISPLLSEGSGLNAATGIATLAPPGASRPVLDLQSETIGIAEQLDALSYRTISVGFLLLSVGLVSGAVWANEAWGSWWSWDPKETWALICWLVYAAYLHTRLVRGWQGRRPALVASLGLVVISICYIGVNLLGIGLHSYGWFFDS